MNTIGKGRPLFLSSTQGTKNGTTNSDLTFNLRDPITAPNRRARVALVNAVIPMSFYPVNASNNHITVIQITPTEITSSVTLTPRTYTGDSLAAELTAQFAANGLIEDLTFTYVASELKLQVVNTSTNGILIGASSVIGSPPGGILVPGNTLEANLFYMTNPIDVSGPRYVVVDVNLPLESSDASDATRGVLAVIPINAPPGALLYYAPTAPQYLETSVDQLNSIQMRLTDESHNVIDFQDVRWSAQIAFVNE